MDENTPARAQAYNALVRQVARPTRRGERDRPQPDAGPGGVYTATVDGIVVRSSDGIHISPAGGELLQREILPGIARLGLEAEARRDEGTRVSEPQAADAPAAEVVVESVPAAMSLAPNAVGPNLGAEIILDAEARPGVESMRAGLLQAGPLAAAGVLANGASVVLTIALARLLTPHSYGVLNQLTGLYLILSMPGSAVVVAVVRRVTMWHEDGSGHLVRRWAGRVHRQGTMLVLAWAVIVFVSRHDVAVLLNQQSGIGIAAILAAAAFFVLLSLDRGLLQAHRSYQPLAVNLLVETGVRVVAVLVLVVAGFGPSGAAVGVLIGEVVAAATRARPPCGPGRRVARPLLAGRRLGGGRAARPGAGGRRDGAAHGGARPRGGVRLALHGRGAAERRRARRRTRQPDAQRRLRGGVGDEQGDRLRRHRARRLPAARGGHPMAPGRARAATAGRRARPARRPVRAAARGGVGRARRRCSRWCSTTPTPPPPTRWLRSCVAMILLSVSVVLTMYLLAVGRRWVAGVLGGRRRGADRGRARGARGAPGDGLGRPRRPGRRAAGDRGRLRVVHRVRLQRQPAGLT